MTTPQIERLIAEAISNRPKVTNAPMNLYIHNETIMCGARSVMPKNAAFLTHISPTQLVNGFTSKEWEFIVKKTWEITEDKDFQKTKSQQATSKQNGHKGRTQTNLVNLRNRRREERLHYRRPMWFTQDSKETLARGVMLDVSSGGLAFTCYSNQDQFSNGQKIITGFEVPRFGANNLSMENFDRTGEIRRVDKSNNALHHIAVEFSYSLPFKPGEQSATEHTVSKIPQKTKV